MSLSGGFYSSLFEFSATVVPLLREVGDHLFRAGAPFSTHGHLVAFAQRLADFRLCSRPCWDMVPRSSGSYIADRCQLPCAMLW